MAMSLDGARRRSRRMFSTCVKNQSRVGRMEKGCELRDVLLKKKLGIVSLSSLRIRIAADCDEICMLMLKRHERQTECLIENYWHWC